MTNTLIHSTAKCAWSDLDNPRNRVQPGYNDIGLYDTSSIASDIVWCQLTARCIYLFIRSHDVVFYYYSGIIFRSTAQHYKER